MLSKRCSFLRCYFYCLSSAFFFSFIRSSLSLSNTFQSRSSLSSCSLIFLTLFWHSFHYLTALYRFSNCFDLLPCLGWQQVRVELTLGFTTLICMILSSLLNLFFDLFSRFSSLLLMELKLLLRTDFLVLSFLFSSLNFGLTFSLMILSYLDSLLYAETKLVLLCFFSFRQELLDLMELSNLLLLLQKEKSRLMLEALLDADEVQERSRLFFDLERLYG